MGGRIPQLEDGLSQNIFAWVVLWGGRADLAIPRTGYVVPVSCTRPASNLQDRPTSMLHVLSDAKYGFWCGVGGRTSRSQGPAAATQFASRDLHLKYQVDRSHGPSHRSRCETF